MAQYTPQQRKALHLWFTMLADELNAAGLDQRKILKPSIDIPWSAEAVKEQVWRPIMKAQLGKDSTTELESQEIDLIFNTITKHLGEKFGLTVAFPSIETLVDRERN